MFDLVIVLNLNEKIPTDNCSWFFKVDTSNLFNLKSHNCW